MEAHSVTDEDAFIHKMTGESPYLSPVFLRAFMVCVCVSVCVSVCVCMCVVCVSQVCHKCVLQVLCVWVCVSSHWQQSSVRDWLTSPLLYVTMMYGCMYAYTGASSKKLLHFSFLAPQYLNRFGENYNQVSVWILTSLDLNDSSKRPSYWRICGGHMFKQKWVKTVKMSLHDIWLCLLLTEHS